MQPVPIETLSSQFNKCDHTQDQGEDDNNVNSPAVMVGLIIAALTFVVAAVPLFRSPRFRRWVSSFSISSFVKVYLPPLRHISHINPQPSNHEQKDLGIISPPSPLPTTTTAKGDLS